MVGVRAAGTILAINHDPNAPVFDHCDIGIVGDWHEWCRHWWPMAALGRDHDWGSQGRLPPMTRRPTACASRAGDPPGGSPQRGVHSRKCGQDMCHARLTIVSGTIPAYLILDEVCRKEGHVDLEFTDDQEDLRDPFDPFWKKNALSRLSGPWWKRAKPPRSSGRPWSAWTGRAWPSPKIAVASGSHSSRPPSWSKNSVASLPPGLPGHDDPVRAWSS